MSERPLQLGVDEAVASSVDTPEVSASVPTTIPTSSTPEAALPSLPPAVQDADPAPSQALQMKPKVKRSNPYKMTKDSVVRKKAVAILAMRANGFNDLQIAEELGISKNSVHVYLYRAARAGKLVTRKGQDLLIDPADKLQYELAHKAVENLSAMLDSSQILERGQKSVKMEATKLVAEGMLFKRFDTPKETTMPTNVLQINIQGHQGKVDVTEGGAPLYVDGELVKGVE